MYLLLNLSILNALLFMFLCLLYANTFFKRNQTTDNQFVLRKIIINSCIESVDHHSIISKKCLSIENVYCCLVLFCGTFFTRTRYSIAGLYVRLSARLLIHSLTRSTVRCVFACYHTLKSMTNLAIELPADNCSKRRASIHDTYFFYT